jgi:hypothetical protein
MIPVHSTRKVGGRLREREDWHCVIVAEDRDILLRNALVEILFVFVANLLVMRFWIALE